MWHLMVAKCRFGSVATLPAPGLRGSYAPNHDQTGDLPMRRKGPNNRTSDRLFNHLVGGHLHDLRHREVQRLGGLEVDHELEFGGLHNRQVGGFFTL
jgi:hypothetical protein